MRARIKIRILACLAIMIAICMMSGCMSRKEQDRRNEELVAAYPEEVKAYLEERYGREFCVNPKPIGRGGSPIPFASEDYFTCKELPENNLRILFRVNLIKSVNFATGLRRLFGGIS